jgi:putative endonuclease
MWYVYALVSLKDNNLYIGISEDPDKRLKMHNSGMTTSTKYRRPFKIIYTEVCENRLKAREREKYFKSGFGREFLKQFI